MYKILEVEFPIIYLCFISFFLIDRRERQTEILILIRYNNSNRQQYSIIIDNFCNSDNYHTTRIFEYFT